MRGIETFVCSTIYIYTCIYVSIFYSKGAEATFFFGEEFVSKRRRARVGNRAWRLIIGPIKFQGRE